MLKSLDIALIDTSRPRLRQVNPAWVEAFAAEIAEGSALAPIEVAEQPNGTYRLITGAHRLAAYVRLDRKAIEARVFAASDFADENAYLLKEVQENIVRAELTALDRASSILAWKRIYEETSTLQKRGRKAKAELIANSANNSAPAFAERFSLAAARVLDISERSVQCAVNIANNIAPQVKARIFDQPIADRLSELLQLAAQDAARQMAIVDLMMADPEGNARAGTVTDAIAILDQIPAPAPAAPWQRVNDTFARLREADRFAFFDVQSEEIARWQATRKPKGRRAA